MESKTLLIPIIIFVHKLNCFIVRSSFQVEGLFLDALVFYRTHVSSPVGSQIQALLSHPLPPTFVDHAIILTIFFSSMIRVMLYRQKTVSGKSSYTLAFLVCYFGILYSLANEYSTKTTEPQLSLAWTFFPAVLAWITFSLKGAERILVTAYLLTPVFVAGILGAISSGLSR